MKKLILSIVLLSILCLGMAFVGCGGTGSSSDDEGAKTTYTATFIADGEVVKKVEFEKGAKSIKEPAVPSKDYYYGEWKDYTLGEKNIKIYAEYTPIEYDINFLNEDETVYKADKYTIERKPTVPSVPEKAGYTGVWEEISYTYNKNTPVKIKPVYTAISVDTFTVTFYAEGVLVDTVEFTKGATSIEEPTVPSKDYYEGAWERYTLGESNIIVNAIYTAIEYDINFLNENETIYLAEKYTIDNKPTVPAVPEKEGYTGVWEEITYTYNKNTPVKVKPVYTPISVDTFTVTFYAEGVLVDTVAFTKGATSIEEPTVPSKDYYEGAWESYTLGESNITVNAEYTAIEYDINFLNEDETIYLAEKYTIDNKPTVPAVPEKEGYTGAWEEFEYTYDKDNAVEVKPVYTAISGDEFTVTFYAEGVLVKTVEFTKGATSVEEPAVPSKEHFTGAWESYTLGESNINVNVVYTPIEYTLTFKVENNQLCQVKYDVTMTSITEPSLAASYPDYYWPDYKLSDGGDRDICAVMYSMITITFVKTKIYNKNGNEEKLSSYVQNQIQVPTQIIIKDKSQITVDAISDFTIYYENGGSKTCKQLKWVYKDASGNLHEVKSGTFDKSNYENSTDITLYMQYSDTEIWTPNY